MNRLIARPRDGFSNRLKCLISASLRDKEYQVVWRAEEFCGLRLGDIFRDASREVTEVPRDATVLDTWRFELPLWLRDLVPVGFSDCARGYKGIEFPGDSECRTIDFEYLRIPHRVQTALSDELQKFVFTDEVLGRRDALLGLLPSRYVGAHVRTWPDAPARRLRWFDYDEYVAAISRFGGEEVALVCDDPSFARAVLAIGDGRVIAIGEAGTGGARPWQSRSGDQMLTDIAELLVLGNASRLILSPMSTYSEIAWLLAGCTEQVYFGDPAFRGRGHDDRFGPTPEHDEGSGPTTRTPGSEAWSLRRDIAALEVRLEEMQADVDERTAWALRLDSQCETARKELLCCRSELDALRQKSRADEARLAGCFDSPMARVKRALHHPLRTLHRRWRG